jgi:hypothetical protein
MSWKDLLSIIPHNVWGTKNHLVYASQRDALSKQTSFYFVFLLLLNFILHIGLPTNQ